LNTMSVTSLAESLRILVVDDFVPFRDTLREFFDEFVFIEVVGEAGDGNSAIQMAFELIPQVILMDVRMPGLTGIEATRRIKRDLPAIHIIGVSSFDDTVTREAMEAAGSSAFTAKIFVHTLPHIISRVTGKDVAQRTPCVRSRHG
jgi:DNA-binding NarL/FixJ family response regulator